MRKKDPLLKIKDLHRFSRHIGVSALKECGINTSKEKLKDYITQHNITEIVTQYAKTNNKGEYFINNRIFAKIHGSIIDWVVGVSLAKAASEGEIDCYWDNEKNCMMFSKTLNKDK
jgi:hypothetical protein